jgi:hypothetical protein
VTLFALSTNIHDYTDDDDDDEAEVDDDNELDPPGGDTSPRLGSYWIVALCCDNKEALLSAVSDRAHRFWRYF